METKIRSQFKVELLQLPRNVRSLKVEDYYYEDSEKENELHNLTVECAKVAVSVTNSVSHEVKTTVKGKSKKRTTTSRAKKSSIMLASGPTYTNARRSTRKRTQPSWLSETPLASSTLTAAALGCTTAKTRRTKGPMVAATPASSLSNISSIHPLITPKFDMATPMCGTAMRTQKPDEKFLVSMNGSPVWLGNSRRTKKNDNLIPLPLGKNSKICSYYIWICFCLKLDCFLLKID